MAITYGRFGRDSSRLPTNTLLDSLLPEYEVREVLRVCVRATTSETLSVARAISFLDSPLVRAIFALREAPLRLRGISVAPLQPRPILAETAALGWRQIGDETGRQIIMGAVTQPWKQHVEFRGLLPDEFRAFDTPDYAKIAWTFEVEALDASSSIFRTETRVLTTDAASREKFRRYWSFLSPGILLIRFEMLRLVKSKAEARQGEKR